MADAVAKTGNAVGGAVKGAGSVVKSLGLPALVLTLVAVFSGMPFSTAFAGPVAGGETIVTTLKGWFAGAAAVDPVTTAQVATEAATQTATQAATATVATAPAATGAAAGTAGAAAKAPLVGGYEDPFVAP